MFDLIELPITVINTTVSPLAELKHERCVVLSIKDKKMRTKKRARHPVLMIAPASMYGDEEEGIFLFSIPGYGAELIVLQEIKAMQLYRLGMTMKASGILVNEINELFKK